MGIRKCPLILGSLIVCCLLQETLQNTRHKRQIQPEMPRILTQDGHLIFQSGTNHNLTFRATNGGFVNIGSDNLGVIMQTVKDNKLAIDNLRTAPTASSSLESRLASLEARLNNLQPTGQVQTSLLMLGHRIDLIQAQTPDNTGTRLTAVEGSLANLQPTGQVQTLISQLTTRVTALEGQANQLRALRRVVRRLNTMGRRVNTRVNRLRTLLTRDECESNPCSNGGTCIDTYNGFICRCPSTFTGSTCEEDVNECAIYAGTDLGCQNGATCLNSHGGFSCQCSANWHGIRCTERHEDCTGASSSELCGHGTCVNVERVQAGQPKYRCICDQGWTTSTGGSDPACTQDVDECNDGRPHCSVNPLVQCINLPGSFQCGNCPSGYSGNGFMCTDVNECALSNGGCSTSPMVQCINTLGSRTCGPCPAGYQGDGMMCTWVGVCQINNGGCHPQAACTESPGFQGRSCTCSPGYVGNGVGAAGCVAQGAQSGACSSTPCQNGAVCQSSGSGYRCVCQPGYTGQNCQTNINECASNPCQNGGSCSDRVNAFSCQCTDSYTGANCEVEQQTCGALLTGETGTFRYPGLSGGQVPHDMSCAWRIMTTYGKMLIITFPSFNLESHNNCNYDFLQINDGPTAASRAIGRYCGSDTPNNGQPINSTAHQLYFWLYTDATVASDGFQVQWRSALPACGGNLVGSDHGDFSSPGYPGNYPHDRDCVWRVTVSPGNNIMFTFATLALESHPDCSYDYLEVRDGISDTSPLLQRYCNSTSPAPLSTSGPSAWVKFHSDSSQSDTGFHITYTAVQDKATRPAPVADAGCGCTSFTSETGTLVSPNFPNSYSNNTNSDAGCGGTFTSETGTLISPNFPNAYSHDASCVWVITVATRDTLTLTFTDLDLEGSDTCQYDYLEVRDGNAQNSPLLGKFCGSDLPVPPRSSGNSLFVKFVSDLSVAHAGFRATWSVDCGGTFTDPSGVIRSPYYPEPYPSNRHCVYMLSQPVGQRITLNFTAFDVESSRSDDNCQYDYLTVKDGGAMNSPVIGQFCGPQIPEPITSSSNMLYLEFVTDGSVQNQGFQASYESTVGCGQVLTDTIGMIQSPGHPNTYPHGVNCTWRIQVTPGLVVRLTFLTFSLESHVNCRYDAVDLYDGPSISDSSLGSYCGNTIPPVVTSTNNDLLIVFTSDSSVAHEGFTAHYTTINATMLCGGDLTDPMGEITSPGFPQNYPHQRACVWTITAPQGQQIMLNITDFLLEGHHACNYDYLEIRNGGFPTSPLVNRYCGNTIDSIIVSHSNRMYLKFSTDHSISAKGFRLFYDATSTGCGADLTSATGSFVSPNYPSPYGHNAECFWTITVARGSRLQLAFVDFDIERHSNCNFDYLEIRETDANGAVLGKLCGNSIPQPITSSSNKLWVKYRTDYSVSGRGFHAFYHSLCGGNLTDFHGVIESPNFPNPYPHLRYCTWLVQATLGNTINATFSHFHMESDQNCRFDYLQLRDGNSASSDLIGSYCGSTIPPQVATTGQYLWINFRSDMSVAMNGFRLEYINDGCGGYLTSPTGTIMSPNYPQPYPHRRVCEWTIVVDTGSHIELNIDTFDLESQRRCRWDVLEVYAGRDTSSSRLTQMCHRRSSPMVLSNSGNMMFLRFRSDFSVAGNGFHATYKSIPGGCGGNFSTPTGVIQSRNWPQPFPHNTDCGWLINVGASNTVILNFTDFDIEGSADCQNDYVTVYDGADSSSPQLLTHCDNSLPVNSLYRSSTNFMYTNVTNTFLLVYDGADSSSPQLLTHCGNSLPVNSLYRSSTNLMYVRMMTNGSASGSGFSATYKRGCGASLTVDGDGEITSPNYPGRYNYGDNCTWILTAANSYDRIRLTFTHMDTEDRQWRRRYSGNCTHDYVLVRDGNDASAPLVGRYCGNAVPPVITSQGSVMFVQFISDRSVQRTGFRATYTTSNSACGGDFGAVSGTFSSPGYPNFYPINTECVWTVRASPGNKVAMNFDVFNLEDHETCNSDYVEIHEGQLGGPLVGRYCGNTVPANLTAYSGIWMKFRSDSQATAQGFVAQYSGVFGGDITGMSGQIASPMYPSIYPRRTVVKWTITVPDAMRIRVTFQALDVLGYHRCRFAYIMFRDGGSRRSSLLGRYCGSTLPETFVSSGNQLWVKFRSSITAQGSGFLFDWVATYDTPRTTPAPTVGTTPVPGCGGVLNVTEGLQTVTSPGYPDGYADNLNCVWTMFAPLGSRVQMNITDINLESHYRCNYDKIIIYDSATTSGRQLGRYCGRTGNDDLLLSTTNRATLRLTTDYSVNRTGFSLQYQAVCGGTIDGTTGDSGEIKSPQFPGNYPANSNCTWKVHVLTGRTIRVEFPTFNIEGTQGSCGGDYVMLLNGYQSNSPPLGNTTTTNGRYCGSTPPVAMETSSNYLYVNFLSDGTGSAPGFSLQFSEITVTCGGAMHLNPSRTSMVFTSPNYPGNYQQNVDCTWVITAPAHELIQVDFQETFAIESHRQCRYDYIQIRDGGTVNSPVLGTHCGYDRPSSLVTTGNVMFARFRTDYSIARQGFKAQVKIATCGGHYAGTSGSITSPNYPGNYDNNLDCVWTINAPTGHYMTLTFDAFRLQWSSNCSAADYLEIREFNSTGDVLFQGCGSSLPQALITADSYAYIRLVTNNRNQNSGFKLNYESSVEECGGDLTTNSGSFSSPNFPNSYPHSRVCTWKITVQQGRRITFRFDPFNLESHRRCYYDYVGIYNGIYPNSVNIGRYCGDNPPVDVKSSGNTAKVIFRTDGSISNGGFRAFYTSDEEAECGGYITSSQGNITSPGYSSGNYSNRLECVWTLANQAFRNSSILLRVNDLDLEHHSTCWYDFLEIREGTDADGQMLEKFCGNNTLPPPFVSPMGNLWLRFKTDASIVSRGFHLSYNFTQCGGVLTNPNGIIASPNYPANYDHNDACAWLILAPEGTRVEVTITDFALEDHPACRFDYVDMFNGQYASSPSIGKMCGTKPSQTLRFQSNAVRITFVTDESMSARGFRLTYNFATRGCGGLLHAETGNITTPNYPSSYPHNAECVWDINVAQGYTVNLTFLPPFDMQAGANCDYDYVEVSNQLGNGSLVPRGRWCQNILPPPQVSSSHRLVVKFRSDATTNGNGFSATWTTTCGGLITEFPGILNSPGFPDKYDNNLKCNYTLKTDPQHYIMLRFDPDNFDIESASSCHYDVLRVYNGNSSSSPRLGSFCGQTAPQPLSALGSMLIQFWTDRSVVNNGWRAHYSVSECGGEFTNPSDIIGTPTETNYHNNQNCTWHITVQTGRIVDIKFNQFELEHHGGCRWDYVAVYDGPSTASRLLGRFCGNTVPTEQLRSTSNTMTVNLVTDVSFTYSGFSAVYRTTYGADSGCGGVLNTTSSGQFGSLDIDLDGQYENDLDCRWLIIGGDNKVITLTIPSLDIEASPTCAYDFLKIYDGMSMQDPLVGTYCGSNTPGTITSASNVLLVQFYADVSVTAAGFNASYVQEDAMCGGAFTSSDTPQTITSPGYPNAFRQTVQCRWTIDAPSETENVMIAVTAIDLQNRPECLPEYLEFRDYPLVAQGRVVDACGPIAPPAFYSFFRSVQINYAATSGASTGFSLTYQTAGCSRNYTGDSGQIFSPGWPGGYIRNLDCSINIMAPDNMTVALYFNMFAVEPHPNCNYDYLEIRNGSSTDPVLTKMCGWTIPDPVFATTNVVSMRFRTDYSVQHPGFDITYTASTQGIGCGGNIVGINGSLTSPLYPGNYTEASTCIWRIRVPGRRTMALTFTDLQVPGGTENCGTDYVELYDDSMNLSSRFGRYCGAEVPATLTTTSNIAAVQFVSSGTGNPVRFRLKFAS